MEELVLVISSGDWGDELNLEGFAIYAKKRWEEIKEGIPEEAHEAYYGSNEFVYFENKEDYLSYIVEKEISLEKANEIVELLTGKKNKINLEDSFFLRYGFSYGLFVINSDTK